ncbi:RHH-type proline utilization regulon transcriptional repressor/proline dehydrogenase/delta 1-pyrroline-5-carboxylate dehydrogenase [Paraburkholderia terricola]|uniref:bifunctional proline dehydrogenase/L-glutamate gamma-semialdehyde dehydrogenase PutA n=1 Tax=Paraburkholderia terricola TaxID=169427 RepID=UPI00285D3C5D|nr:bifunctional proline dehydrogenase/L-glutamate gamma-semialdehyde dehydrogenase PutA [Paraburkholderia terricola]MDR6496437.1 RHH-type proline utilization regulon transcriptional repressor/proline dehydrogenase/delta 1-pyrroline-5-carboxylate dehydrogenase [Paraburkholderia terricola]
MLSEIEEMQTVASNLTELRQRITDASALPEDVVVKALMQEAQMDSTVLKKAQSLAAKLAQGVREARIHAGGVDLLTQEFSLDSREGIALMCLAEAMLRIPDTETRNQLIRDKIVDADWRAHIGKSPSLFVNATAWGLLVTGKLLKQPDENALGEALTRVVRKGGEAVVRAGVAYAMRMLGKQFVTGQTIEEAIGVAKGRESGGYRYSYDMLGEAALTDEDAHAYFESYRHAIEGIGKDANGQGPIDGPGVSVKISGLHPRYELAQRERVLVEMYPRLLQLAQLAKQYGIGFHLDQEESARFELTLEMLERLCKEPSLRGWNGIGISLQAYQKRGRAVAEWIIALARSTSRRVNIRLVKGAYWDTEIKLAQDSGAVGYPVFTRKVHSDVSYIACAKALLGAPDAIFPQFATHNAFTVAAVHTLAGDKEYEFQCLHGMGETVYDQVVGPAKLGRPCRIYAPVGPHATLLAYLVRRLLENGANSSFVNQIVDPAVSIADIVQDPVAKAALTGGKPHGGIASPRAVLPGRVNAISMDFGDLQFTQAVDEVRSNRVRARALLAGADTANSDSTTLRYSASNASDVIGSVEACLLSSVTRVVESAIQAFSSWKQSQLSVRETLLETLANELEKNCFRLGAVLVLENGATLSEAVDEVRSSVNLCRLYAYQLANDERVKKLEPLGPVISITPASSPLSTFVGQVATAIAGGNVVIAKPSSDASLVAYEATRLFHQAGVPKDVLQLLLGQGDTLGNALTNDHRVAAVLFSGSKEVAKAISLDLAKAPQIPKFVAFCGGVNAMIVDSSALPEQVISDAIVSAFKGAGQNASSLRLLCLQDSTADRVLRMLKGMLSERTTGDPLSIATDVGPVATRRLRDKVETYVRQLGKQGFEVVRGKLSADGSKGQYVAPTIVDLGDVPGLSSFDASVSGPVLHVVRYRTGQLDALLSVLNDLGCGVQGLHTRINEASGKLLSFSKANSVCVNRVMHSAFAGMQPYGGVGATGTGPMGGGPLTLLSLSRSAGVLLQAKSGPFAPSCAGVSEKFYEFPVETAEGKLINRASSLSEDKAMRTSTLNALLAIAKSKSIAGNHAALASWLRGLVNDYAPLSLPALTGEENTVEILPRGKVLCAAQSAEDILTQVLYASAFGNHIVLTESSISADIRGALGAQCHVIAHSSDVARLLAGDSSGTRPDVVLVAAGQRSIQDLRSAGAAQGTCVLVGEQSGAYDWTRLVRERVTTVNASAAGGNTQLMVMSEDAL